MFDYSSVVDPLSVRSQAVRIVAPFANEYAWNMHQPAAIFDFVKSTISYVQDPIGIDYPAPPLETIQCGGGDCDCHAVLVSSLCEAVGIPTRLVLCWTSSMSHLLCQVNFGRQDHDVVFDNLYRFYNSDYPEHYKDTNDGFYWQHASDGDLWIFADTAACRYFGDILPLVNYGFINMNTDRSTWKWRESIEVFERRL
ncbi:transglutaminase family protein [Candidatus Latescibacterota bacterium]